MHKYHIFANDTQFIKAASLPGHEDWIKTLAFQEDVAGPNSLTLASGSHDATIRLWNIEKYTRKQPEPKGQSESPLVDELLEKIEVEYGHLGEKEENGGQLSMKRHILTVEELNGRYACYFSLRIVHSNWLEAHNNSQ